MDPLEEAVRGRPSRRINRQTAVAAAIAGVLVIGSVASAALYAARPADPQIAAAATPTPTPTPTATPAPSPTPSPTPTATPSASPLPTPAGPDPVLGHDGRLTVLLLGSDYRPAHPGNRTDTVMVVSVDPTTDVAAAASIPRDTVNFPLGGKRTYKGKINALYQALIRDHGRDGAGREMKRLVGAALGIEIDWYAVIGFEGVRRLVDAVGGVDVVLPKAVNDPYYWVTSTKRGVHFRAGRNHLDGKTALIFARTRKGDNDFERARRQQLLVAGAIRAVRDRGLERLPRLIAIAARHVRTDLPLKAAPSLYAIVAGADLDAAERIVFGPRTWAASTGGSSFALKLDAVRGWTARWMAPVEPTPAPAVPIASPGAPVLHPSAR